MDKILLIAPIVLIFLILIFTVISSYRKIRKLKKKVKVLGQQQSNSQFMGSKVTRLTQNIKTMQRKNK